jgi:hypothetical protein
VGIVAVTGVGAAAVAVEEVEMLMLFEVKEEEVGDWATMVRGIETDAVLSLRIL